MSTKVTTNKVIGEVNLYQHYENVEGINLDKKEQLKIAKNEIWYKCEIDKLMLLINDPDVGEYLKKLIWEKDCNIPEIPELINFINMKRAYIFKNSDGKAVMVSIPSNRVIKEGQINHYNNLLFRIVIAHWYWVNAKETEKAEKWISFKNTLQGLKNEIAKRIFSKNFKEKYQIKFIGFNSVALTADIGFDEVIIPKSWAKKRNINIGDLCIIKRDPVQNIFVTAKVIGFDEESVVRVNCKMFTILDGDFDGDQCAVIPVKLFIECNKKYFTNPSQIDDLYSELEELLPSKILANSKYDKLTREYK